MLAATWSSRVSRWRVMTLPQRSEPVGSSPVCIAIGPTSSELVTAVRLPRVRSEREIFPLLQGASDSSLLDVDDGFLYGSEVVIVGRVGIEVAGPAFATLHWRRDIAAVETNDQIRAGAQPPAGRLRASAYSASAIPGLRRAASPRRSGFARVRGGASQGLTARLERGPRIRSALRASGHRHSQRDTLRRRRRRGGSGISSPSPVRMFTPAP